MEIRDAGVTLGRIELIQRFLGWFDIRGCTQQVIYVFRYNIFSCRNPEVPLIIYCNPRGKTIKVAAKVKGTETPNNWVSWEGTFPYFLAELKRQGERYGHIAVQTLAKRITTIEPTTLGKALDFVKFPNRVELEKFLMPANRRPIRNLLPKRPVYDPIKDPNQPVLAFTKE